MRLKDKVTLITGGAAGIGKATAQRFQEEGAVVVICDVKEDLGQAVADELGLAAFYKVNVADRQDVQRWIDDVLARFGRIDVLVNNAGVLRDGRLVVVKEGELVKQMPEADWDLVIGVNLKGVFNCTQAVAPVMIKQGSGVIINASSVVGLDGNFGQTNYVATKAGVIGLTKVWARELGRNGIRVNAIAPGNILFPGGNWERIVAGRPEAWQRWIDREVALKRFGRVEEIADAALWLASARASFVTGATIVVDGGQVR